MGWDRLLIVEDEAEIATLIDLTASGVGFVTQAVGILSDLVDAVESFQPTALLVDLSIIGGAGLDVLRTLADSGTKAPLMIMSGSGKSEHAEDDAKSLNLNAVGRLDKPFRRAELYAALERLRTAGDGASV